MQWQKFLANVLYAINVLATLLMKLEEAQPPTEMASVTGLD